jgi:hypothetical protein
MMAMRHPPTPPGDARPILDGCGPGAGPSHRRPVDGVEPGVQRTTLEPPRDAPETMRERARRWAEAERWARTLDSSIRVPGTRARVGWDAIIGLVPGVGDAVGLGLSLLVITRGALLGARRWTIARMALVALLDAAVGTIPVAGSLFDFAFKANERNLRTIARRGADPDAVEAESRRIVLVSLALAVVLGALIVIGLISLVVWLTRQF